MSDQEKKQNQLRGHEFDGIQEYDNDMPRWWVYLFVVTIIFAGIYLAWYHLGLFPSQSISAEYDSAANAQAAVVAAQQQAQPSADSFDYAAATQDQSILAAGKESFTVTCSPCHAVDGGGSVGPNLTDRFWIHGATPADIHRTIHEGVVEKGMPAWGPVLGDEKVRQLTVYVMSLKGTQPAAPKESQGTEEVNP